MIKTKFSKIVFGTWISISQHDSHCDCLQCKSEKETNTKNNKFHVSWPKPKLMSFLTISITGKSGGKTYLKLHNDLKNGWFGLYFHKTLNGGFKLKFFPPIIRRPNCNRALITFVTKSKYQTKIKNIESLFWKSLIIQ